MKIIKETEMVKLDIDMTDKEIKILKNYAKENISIKQYKEMKKNMLIEWALIDIIKKQIKKDTPKLDKEFWKKIRSKGFKKYEKMLD